MADTRTDESRGRRIVTVDYVAADPVHDADRLCEWLRDQIERHLRSITEVPITGWDLRARIEECHMVPNRGVVRVTLDGQVAGRPVDGLIAVADEPAAAGPTWQAQQDRVTDRAFANLVTWLGRLLFPSELVRALGHRRISGRLVRAWLDGCREIRIRIDAAVFRPASGGHRTWRRALGLAILAGLASGTLAVAAKLLFRAHAADDVRDWIACGLIGIGTFGAIAAGGLLVLPSRFYQAEPQGLALARLFGVRSLAGIRFVAWALLTLSIVFALAPGLALVCATGGGR